MGSTLLISVGQDNRSVSPPYQGTGCFRIKPEYFPLPQERVSHIFSSILLLCDNPAAYCNNTSRSPRPDCKNQNPFFQYSCQEIRHILCGHFQPKPQKKNSFSFYRCLIQPVIHQCRQLVDVGFMDLGV